MKKYYFLFIALFIISAAQAQNGYQIKGNIKGIKPEPLTLAHYFGYGQYIVKDTAVADAGGNLTFSGDKPLPEGLYMLLMPNKRRFADFVIGKEQNFTFSTDTANVIGNMKIEGSPDSERFYKYQKQLAISCFNLESCCSMVAASLFSCFCSLSFSAFNAVFFCSPALTVASKAFCNSLL